MKLKSKTVFRLCVAIFLSLSACIRGNAADSNSPNSIVIVQPENGAHFKPGSTITLQARVPEALQPLKRLEFLADGSVVGVVSNTLNYSATWTNVSAGSYKVVARALQENGTVISSEKIRVGVYAAWITFGLDNVEILDKTELFGIPLWQYCASLIYIFLAFYVSKFIDFLTRVWLKRWAEKTQTKFDDLLLDLLNGPTKIISFVIFLRIGLEVFSWPLMVRNFLGKAFTVIVALSLTYTVLKFIDLVMGYWKERTKAEAERAFDEQLFPIIRKSLKVFAIVVATLVTLDNIGVNITAAIASLSIGGLAIGLAAQDTLANLFGAVAVFVDKPFRIGDLVELNGVKGNVESIGLRSTRVRNLDGHLITVPNKTMGNATITNITRRPNIKTEMNFGLTYDTSPEKIRLALKILEETYRGHKMTEDLVLSFNKFADSALNITLVHWWKDTDHRAYLAGMQELNLTIKERFDAEGISFAFPSQTVYLKQDSGWKLERN